MKELSNSKYLLILILLIFCCSSCNNSECFNFWSGIRLFYFDQDENNLMSSSSEFEIISFKTASGEDIEYEIKDWILNSNNPEGIFHLSTISEKIVDECLEKTCKLFLATKVDGMEFLDSIETSIIRVSSRNCTDYSMNEFIVNQNEAEKHATAGGYIIRK